MLTGSNINDDPHAVRVCAICIRGLGQPRADAGRERSEPRDVGPLAEQELHGECAHAAATPSRTVGGGRAQQPSRAASAPL